MEGVEDVGTDALQLLVLGGIPYAVALFGLSLLLFLEGRKRIPMTVGLVGFVIAYSLIGPLYELLGPDPPLTKQMFHLVGAIGVGVMGSEDEDETNENQNRSQQKKRKLPPSTASFDLFENTLTVSL